MDKREQAARAFTHATWPDATLTMLAADASSRRYFRATHPDGRTAIIMDAPPNFNEDVRPFISIAQTLSAHGISAPLILSQDVEAGFLFLEDFGDALFPTAIQNSPDKEAEIYLRACDVLQQVHTIPTKGLAEYTPTMMAEFVRPLFDEYQHRNGPPVPQVDQDRIISVLCAQLDQISPTSDVMILRDFHAENLIWLPERSGIRAVGVLDFQDALCGHRSYDLASLIDDCRRDVPPHIRDACLAHFATLLNIPKADIQRETAIQGAQRNMRILGVFVRLAHVRNKPKYLDLLPRVWQNLMRNLDHPDLRELRELVLASVTPPKHEKLVP